MVEVLLVGRFACQGLRSLGIKIGKDIECMVVFLRPPWYNVWQVANSMRRAEPAKPRPLVSEFGFSINLLFTSGDAWKTERRLAATLTLPKKQGFEPRKDL